MRAVIFANGQMAHPEAARAAIRPNDLVIAANGGAQHCRTLGITPSTVIGDMDSLTSADLEALEAAGAALVRHPVRKDQTDLELAVAFALGCGALEVIVIGGLGNRWDQTLANLLLTAHPEFHGINLSFLDGYQRIYPVNGTITIEGRPGDTVSLIPIGGDAHGVTTHGLEYALEDGTISFGSTLGVSNVLTEQRATVEVKQGIVLCIVIGSEL